jgi:hypothetical protein
MWFVIPNECEGSCISRCALEVTQEQHSHAWVSDI